VLEIPEEKLNVWGFNFNSARETGTGTIIASGRDWGLAEFKRDGQVIWSMKLFKGDEATFQEKGAHDATLLSNGNVLYVSTTTNEVIEAKTNGKVVRTITNENIKLPKNARRLPDGHTLISHSRGIVEVDKKGRIVKETRRYKGCYNFKILSSGGIMLAHYVKGVIFMDADFNELKVIKYNAPESWEVITSKVPSDALDQLKSLGYIQ